MSVLCTRRAVCVILHYNLCLLLLALAAAAAVAAAAFAAAVDVIKQISLKTK